MLIGNLPEDTTPAPDGYIPYSEDGNHLSKISRENFIKGAGHGTGMVYWDEGDGQIVTEGGHTNIPRTVVGSLYSYAVEDDGIAYWMAIYPATYWSAEITEEVRKVWELAYEDGGEITYTAYMDNQGLVYIRGTNNAGASMNTIKARNYVYVDEDGVETNLLDYFMTKFTVGDGLYMGGNNGDVLCAIGATQITINGMTFQLQNDGSFNFDFGGEFDYSVKNNTVNGVTMVGAKVGVGKYLNSNDYFIPHKSLFVVDRYDKAIPLTDAYGSDTILANGFNPNQIFYYDSTQDSLAADYVENDYIFQWHKKVPINDMYGLTFTNGPLYLVGTYGTGGWFYLENVFLAQTIPSTQNNKVYIYLGTVEDGYLDFQLNRPKYWYLDGAIREYSFAPVGALKDIYSYNALGQQASLLGDNGKVGFQGSDTVDINGSSSTSGGSRIIDFKVNTSALYSSLPYIPMGTIINNRSFAVGKNMLYGIPSSATYSNAAPFPYVYINSNFIIRRSDNTALTGQKYKIWFGVGPQYDYYKAYAVGDKICFYDSGVWNYYECTTAIPASSEYRPFNYNYWTIIPFTTEFDQVPYENGEGGYFVDVQSPISGDTELVLSLSGMWKIDNYIQSPDPDNNTYGPIVMIETDTAETLTVGVVIETTRINVPTT